jgi:hypothetical protein
VYTQEGVDGVNAIHIWASSTHKKHIRIYINRQIISIGTLGKNGGYSNYWYYSDNYNYQHIEVGGNYVKFWIYRYNGKMILDMLHYV